MGGKKKYIEMFGFFTEPFSCIWQNRFLAYKKCCSCNL